MATGKKKRQISVWVDEDFYNYFASIAEREKRQVGPLGRILIEWALPYYQAVGSVEKLQKLTVKAGTTNDDVNSPLLYSE